MFGRKRQRLSDIEAQDERQPLLSSLARLPDAELPAESDDLLLRLGTAFGALQGGKMPSTRQLCTLMRSGLLESDMLDVSEHTIEPSRLSKSGQRVLLDVRRLVHALMVLLLSKNAEDQLQEFVYHTRKAKPRVVPDVDVPDVDLPQVTVAEVEEDAQAFLHGLRTLAKVLATNVLSTSNSLLADFFGLIRLVLADTADEVADRSHAAAEALRPSQDEPAKEEPLDTQNVEKEVEELKSTLVDTAVSVKEAAQETAGRETTFKQLARDDTKEVVVRRLERLFKRIQEDRDASAAVVTVFDLTDRYLTRAQETVEAAQKVANETEVDAKVDDPGQHGTAALQALRKIVEAWAGQSLSPLFDNATQLSANVQDNDELATYIHDCRLFVNETLRGGSTDGNDVMSRLSELYDRGVELATTQPTWKRDMNRIGKESASLWDGLTQDEELAALRDALAALTIDFASLTKRAIWTLEGEVGDLWRDVANVILPRLLRYIKHLSVPRTEISTPWIDVVVDDLRLADLVLLPTSVRLTQRTDVSYNREPGDSGSAHLSTATGTLQVAGWSFSAAGISIGLSRKFATWLAYLRRFSTLAELQLPLPGIYTSLSFTRLNQSWAEGTSFTRLDDLTAALDTLKVRLRKSSHPVLTFLLSRLSTPLVRFVLSRVLQQQLRAAYEAADAKLFKIARTAEEAGGSTGDWLSAFSDAFGKEEAEDEDKGDDDDESDAEEGRPLLAGVHLTRVGVVKDDPETDIAVAIGAGPQLIDGSVHGPQYDSLDAVIEDAQRATPSVPAGISSVQDRLDQSAQQTRAGQSKGKKLAAEGKGWRSSAFDLVKT